MGEWHDAVEITVTDRQSLVHLGSLDSFDVTEGGRQAAKLILSYLRLHNKKSLEKAIQIYEKLIPYENFGGEYTSLEWICKLLLAPKGAREEWLVLPLVRSFWKVLSDNQFDNLKTYLTYKYHIKNYNKEEDIELRERMRYLEDFILFNNPDRERWETTRENMDRLELTEGMRVADVGCGPGYFTFKFADLVGETGRVYATETNPRHLAFLRQYVKDYDVRNVEILESSFEGIGLPPEVRVDVVYICSLYHNVYAAFTDAERDSFVGSIRRALGDKGRLIIVDNDLVTGSELPYHGPYINKAMIISQLWYYGFRLAGTYQFTPQRYVLVFDMVDIPTAPADRERTQDPNRVFVDSAASLVRYRIIGTSTSGYTCRGKVWGRLMYEGIRDDDREKLARAHQGFEELWPQERIGDDYTAFLWLIRYYLAGEAERRALAEDLLTATYVNYFSENNWERLKTYLYYKFDLEKPDDPNASIDTNFEYAGSDFPIARLNKWNEYLIFNNPNRCAWEHTDEMLDFCGIRPGETVADIGCGGGYFTWQFAKRVGEAGSVIATEINKGALSYLESFVQEHGIQNIQPMVAKMNDASLPEDSVDVIYMCSMYHAVYITDIEYVKDQFVASLHKALRPSGRLIIVDNNVTEPGVPSYYGPGIKPELIIAQLSHYGFRLLDRWEGTPQRFALIFEAEEGYVPPTPRKFSAEWEDDDQDETKRLLRVLRPRRRGKRKNGDQDSPEGPEDDKRSDH